MKTYKEGLVKLLKEITSKIAEISEDDLSKWMKGEFILKIQFIPKENKKDKQKFIKSKEEHEEILKKLQSLPTREWR